MDWSLIITIILGSSFLSTIFVQCSDYIKGKKQKEKMRHYKLYDPLKFCLFRIFIIRYIRSRYITDPSRITRESEIGKSLNKSLMLSFSKKNWKHINKIEQLFNNYHQLIKKHDLGLVQKFIYAYELRAHIVGKKGDKDLSYVSQNMKTEALDNLIDVLKEMENKFLKKMNKNDPFNNPKIKT